MSDPFRVRVRVRRPAITRPDSKKFHLVHASAGSAAMAVAGLAGFTERPEAASPPSDPDAELTEALATSVDQLCTLLQGHDAFDVMALLRQFLVPPDLALWSESQSGGGTSWGCAEVVALALLGLGLPTRAADNDRRTAGIVPELVARAAAILQLSEMAGLRTSRPPTRLRSQPSPGAYAASRPGSAAARTSPSQAASTTRSLRRPRAPRSGRPRSGTPSTTSSRCGLPLPRSSRTRAVASSITLPWPLSPVTRTSIRWPAQLRAPLETPGTLIAETITRLLHGRGTAWAQLKYRAPGTTNPQVDLSATSTTSQEGDLVESDLLRVVDGVALCVEVKAGDLRPRTRQGGIAQLDGDLNKTVREAAEQADRLRELLTTHHGLWLDDGTVAGPHRRPRGAHHRRLPRRLRAGRAHAGRAGAQRHPDPDSAALDRQPPRPARLRRRARRPQSPSSPTSADARATTPPSG